MAEVEEHGRNSFFNVLRRREYVFSDGRLLKVAEIMEDDLLNGEADGLKDEDKRKSILVRAGRRRG